MHIYYTTRPVKSKTFLEKIFKSYYGLSPALATNAHGKPFLTNASLQFNLSHSGGFTALAVSENPVGLDVERKTDRDYTAIRNRLTAREKSEDFYALWTAKEAYIKYRGESLASLMRSLEYCGGKLFCNGKPLSVCLFRTEIGGCMLTACTDTPEHATLVCCDEAFPDAAE